MKEADSIINLCNELEKEADKLGKEIETLNKSLSIAGGMLYDLQAICPKGCFPISDIIVKKICPGDCAVSPGAAVKCWEHYLIEKAISELGKEKP